MKGLAITGVGAVTPVGLSAPASAAALRAGISRMGSLQSGEEHGPEGAVPPRTGGRVPLEWFDGGPRIEEWPGHERFEVPLPPPEHLLIEDGTERLVRLAVPAVVESWKQAVGDAPPPRDWGLFLGLDTEEEPQTGARLIEALTAALGGFRPALTEVVAEGRAAGLAALHKAATAIAGGQIAGALVGGVDSLVRPTTYKRLEDAGIVKGPSNEHGIISGEAAAFLVLDKLSRTGYCVAVLDGTGTADEPTAGTQKPNCGEGLTAALRRARAAAPLPYAPLMICDLNGDRYRALEWGLAFPRALGDLKWRQDLPTSGEFWHPADCIGDVGAASGMVCCVWAAEALRRGYALTERVLVWGASEGGLRSAAILAPVK